MELSKEFRILLKVLQNAAEGQLSKNFREELKNFNGTSLEFFELLKRIYYASANERSEFVELLCNPYYCKNYISN